MADRTSEKLRHGVRGQEQITFMEDLPYGKLLAGFEHDNYF